MLLGGAAYQRRGRGRGGEVAPLSNLCLVSQHSFDGEKLTVPGISKLNLSY